MISKKCEVYRIENLELMEKIDHLKMHAELRK
jgi:hypothetical protein